MPKIHKKIVNEPQRPNRRVKQTIENQRLALLEEILEGE